MTFIIVAETGLWPTVCRRFDSLSVALQVIARVVDGSRFDEFKAMYGETLITGTVPSSLQW